MLFSVVNKQVPNSFFSPLKSTPFRFYIYFLRQCASLVLLFLWLALWPRYINILCSCAPSPGLFCPAARLCSKKCAPFHPSGGGRHGNKAASQHHRARGKVHGGPETGSLLPCLPSSLTKWKRAVLAQSRNVSGILFTKWNALQKKNICIIKSTW